MSINGGTPVTITEQAGNRANSGGAHWEEDDTILCASRDGIWRVSLAGGTPTELIEVSNGTPRNVAAARFNRAESMRLLLAAGADTKAPETRTNLLSAAYLAPTSAARDELERAGVKLRTTNDLRGPVLLRNRGDLSMLKQLLAAGVDPNEDEGARRTGR